MGLYPFAATVGVAPQTLSGWKKRYEADGPRGLEPRVLGRPKGTRTRSRLPEAVKAAVEETKRRFPIFGLKRIGDFLRRFRGIAVSPGSVKRVLEEAEPPIPVEAPRRKPRRHKLVRRFERSRPGELWQTDITSFLLRRHHRRVYLTVFLDDYSRYVVAWALEPQARGDLVTNCLLDGIQRYGKPREVLSDQGPQYFTWRGKSRFQKLLHKEGIRHVVARTHHPQTLGKCERLWKTVGEELWDRAHPEELEEARERLKHYFAFYNHFRPHQGIEGGIPAERFFGAAEAVKRATQERIDRNALQRALGESPRRTAFLVGQVGDRAVSVHGEAGRLVVQTDEGVYEALDLKDLGIAKEESHGGGNGDGGSSGGGDHDGNGADEEEEAPGVLPDAPAGGGGAGAVGPGERGGAAEGARGGDGDPVVVAGGGAEGGGAGEAAGEAAAPLADVADGAQRDGGRAPQAAEEEGEGAPGDSGGGEPGGAEAEGGAAGAGPSLGAGAGGAAPDASLVEEGCDPTRCPSRIGSGSERSCGREGTPDAGSGPCSPGGTR
jgi:transposase InsO family protein